MITRLPEFEIYRGSTPLLECGLPLELSGSDVVYASFAQGNRVVLEYRINGSADPELTPPTGSMSLDPQNAAILRIQMTQADTLRLEAGDADLQLRIKTNDGADTLIPVHGWVGKAYKGGTI